MRFALSDEQEELKTVVRSFLAAHSSESAVRTLMDDELGYDTAVWTQMSEQLGLHGLAIPEELGGSGYGLVELGVVFEEMGRALLVAPFFSTVGMAATVLMTSDDPVAQARYLPQIASGALLATLALTEESGSWDAQGVRTAATLTDTGWQISGIKSFVVDASVADLFLVVARTGDGLSLFAVEKDARGVTVSPQPALDMTRRQGRVALVEAAGALIGPESGIWPAISKALDIAATLLAAEQVGGAERVLEMSVEYAKLRHQFGRPIGSFQAIKHKCAAMLVEIESARSAAYYALWAGAVGADDFPVSANIAKAFCSDAYFRASGENIQIHGGIGFTWEHPAHLYFKRAKSTALYLGDPQFHRAAIADRLDF